MSTRSEQQQEAINTVQEKLITYQYQNLVNRPLVRHGNAANLEDKTKENFASVKKILLFCPPDWLHSHRRARGLYILLLCYCYYCYYRPLKGRETL